jgi:hypothetical protein
MGFDALGGGVHAWKNFSRSMEWPKERDVAPGERDLWACQSRGGVAAPRELARNRSPTSCQRHAETYKEKPTGIEAGGGSVARRKNARRCCKHDLANPGGGAGMAFTPASDLNEGPP